MDGWTDGRMDGWIDRWVDGWVCEWRDEWMDGRMSGWAVRLVGGWVDKWMHAKLMHESVAGGGWTDGWVAKRTMMMDGWSEVSERGDRLSGQLGGSGRRKHWVLTTRSRMGRVLESRLG